MHDECLFCKIAAGDVAANIEYEDKNMMIFHDIAPKADTHLLLIPKKHIAGLNELTAKDEKLIALMMLKIPEIAKARGLVSGFRTIINTGRGGGQLVFHLHIHLLGGKNLPGFG